MTVTMATVIDAGTNRQQIELDEDMRRWDEFVKSPRGKALLHKDYVRDYLARFPETKGGGV